MNQLPQIHAHFEPPFKYIKHVQRFETNIFPTCHTFIKEWKVGKIPFAKSTHLVSIHHIPTCKYNILDITEKSGQLRLEELSG